jgi:2-polyprenyl-3-methyl-5-hydroxy-6-metoxy-1,4-benzoquinol methylase
MDLAQVERTKYVRMWREPSYRNWSPGEASVQRFLDGVDWHPHETVVDLGCGTGRAGVALEKAGLDVVLVDCCREAVEPAAAWISFSEQNLWSLHPSLPVYDWIYCVDVLEHLPTEQIDAALDGFARITKRGGFLQIALFEDHCGTLIGETLHLTVKPHEWWREKIAARWTLREDGEGTDIRGIEGYATFLLGAPHAKLV